MMLLTVTIPAQLNNRQTQKPNIKNPISQVELEIQNNKNYPPRRQTYGGGKGSSSKEAVLLSCPY